jgi:predicted DNA-binding transcriptional regulator AlpA
MARPLVAAESTSRGGAVEPRAALLTPSEVAEIFGVSQKTLETWRRVGEGPRSVRVSPKVIRYLASDVDAFVLARAGGGGH